MLYSLQAVSILFTKTLKPFLWGFTGSLLMVATQAAEETLNDSTIQKISQLERVEFAFVLLPEPSTLKEIHNVAQEIAKTLAPLSQQSQNLIWGEDCNKVVRMPHVSVGQYGLLGLELPTLSHLVSEVAQQFTPVTEEILPKPSVTKENIFMDFLNIREKTNQTIIDLYIKLRERYMAEIQTRFPITQALLERFSNKEDHKELKLLDQGYQNWGTPEDNRIRPHFTLFYNHTASEMDCKKALENFTFPNTLSNITFTKLGIMQIDLWGNPTKLLYQTEIGTSG